MWVLIGAGASKPAHAVVSIDSKRVELKGDVADDNRRASDNLATRDYPSLHGECNIVDQRSEAGLLSSGEY